MYTARGLLGPVKLCPSSTFLGAATRAFGLRSEGGIPRMLGRRWISRGAALPSKTVGSMGARGGGRRGGSLEPAFSDPDADGKDTVA